MDHNRPAPDLRSRIVIRNLGYQPIIIVHGFDPTGILAPDLDTEPLDIETVVCNDIRVHPCEQELVILCAVDRSNALELGLGSGDHQPFIRTGVEIQVGDLEPRHAGRYRCALLVLGDKNVIGCPIPGSAGNKIGPR